MPMTKAEQALVQELRERAALTLPPYEKPQPMTMDEIAYRRSRSGHGYVEAWFQNAHTSRVTLGWTTGYSHRTEGAVPVGENRHLTGSQTGGRPYATRLQAYRAMRWEATREAMAKLARIDRDIEQIMAMPVDTRG